MSEVYQVISLGMHDDEIVAGLLDGSPAAADALIDRFGQPLLRYFAVHLPDRSQAEDMAQEVFLRLMGTLRRTAGAGERGNVRSLYSLVFTIARHLAIDVQKTAGRRPKIHSLDEERNDGDGEQRGPVLVHLADTAPGPRERADAGQRQRRLDDAIRQLPAEYRDVLVLRHVEELSAKHIAEILGIREGTVWSRLGRALEALRAELAENPSSATSESASPRTTKQQQRKGGVQ